MSQAEVGWDGRDTWPRVRKPRIEEARAVMGATGREASVRQRVVSPEGSWCVQLSLGQWI